MHLRHSPVPASLIILSLYILRLLTLLQHFVMCMRQPLQYKLHVRPTTRYLSYLFDNQLPVNASCVPHRVYIQFTHRLLHDKPEISILEPKRMSESVIGMHIGDSRANHITGAG